ncbi:MAG TPA: hypothetical protein DER01_13970 [Phycisphaerales bacterium]|nr:hypothetical protein [Phycisphaerales bacterium]
MAEAQQPDDGEKQSKLPMKAIIIVASILLLEGIGISAAFMVAGKPSPVEADPAALDAEAMANQQVEELVVSDKFPNSKMGRTYLYDTEVYILLRRKHRDRVMNDLQNMNVRISSEISTIFRSIDPLLLEEPTLATLRRQIKAKMDDTFGKDEQTGQPLVEDVLIRKCTRFRADY